MTTAFKNLVVQSKLPGKINVCCTFSLFSDSNTIKGSVPPYLGTDSDLYSSITIGSILQVKEQEQLFEPIKCLCLSYKGETLFKGSPPYVGVSFGNNLIATIDSNKKVTFTFDR